MVRNCYVYFILHYAWRWIQNTAKLFNSTALNTSMFVSRTIEIALTWRPVPKQIGILLMYVSLIIMVRNCYVYFILHYAWRRIQNTAKLLNKTALNTSMLVSRTIEIVLTWRPVPKQIGILHTYVSLIIMVRNCYVYFILHYAWRWIQNTAKLLN